MAESIARMLQQGMKESVKRKLSEESSMMGNSPKRTPDMNKLLESLPSDTPEWGMLFFSKLLDIEGSHNHKADYLISVVAEYMKRLEDMEGVSKQQSQQIENLEYKVAKLAADNKALNNKVVMHENQSRRDNLLVYGFTEERGETDTDCKRKVYQLLTRKLGIEPAVVDNMRVVRCHRKGPYRHGKNRPIIIKMHFFPDKQYIISQAHNLRNTNYYINEDYAAETESQRRELYPIVKAARKLPQYKDKVKLNVDKLIVDGKAYTTATIHDLPAPLNPENIATRKDDKHVRFFGSASKLSNFHSSPFQIEGLQYSCVEQYYQKAKADEFGDTRSADRIMATANPKQMYDIGQNIDGFSKETWRTKCENVMLKGLSAKFKIPKFKQFLLALGDKLPVECNGFDPYWGIGLYMDDPRSTNEQEWQGENRLGQLIAKVREDIKAKTI